MLLRMSGAIGAPRAIIFDWAGVFCSPGELFSHPEFARQTGLTVDELGAQAATLQDAYYRGTIYSQDFWSGVIAQFSLQGVSIEDLSAAYLASYRLYPEMLELAESLREHCPTLLLSNLTQEMMDEIVRAHDIKNYFDHTLFSNEIGKLKPEPEAFSAALERLGTKAQDTLFIDDTKKNIEAAEELGMQTLLFLSPEQCKTELIRRTSAGADHRPL
jgi:HAD superfamily hydrolase (TIGR01509 family)